MPVRSVSEYDDVVQTGPPFLAVKLDKEGKEVHQISYPALLTFTLTDDEYKEYAGLTKRG